jgi:hypothetical protein
LLSQSVGGCGIIHGGFFFVFLTPRIIWDFLKGSHSLSGIAQSFRNPMMEPQKHGFSTAE